MGPETQRRSAVAELVELQRFLRLELQTGKDERLGLSHRFDKCTYKPHTEREALEFERGEAKNRENLRKHDVRFETAKLVFDGESRFANRTMGAIGVASVDQFEFRSK